jgi:hypothetical protein
VDGQRKIGWEATLVNHLRGRLFLKLYPPPLRMVLQRQMGMGENPGT